MRTGTKLTIIALLMLFTGTAAAEPTDTLPTKRLGVVATAHLDTQWRWTVKNTIEEYIPNTLHDNFALFEAYPEYVFSFEGAFRYMLMKEYYPEEYERLKGYVADGRWRVTGSWVDAVDVNLPSFESLVRHTLYGNAYYKKEFGKQSYDIFMPDCFGFGYALPSLAHHCGLRSFSTQKLTWGCSVDIPFAIGQWRGVDGSTVLSGLRTGNYASELRADLSRDTLWTRVINELGDRSGCYAGFRYFGTGDVGGSPDSLSVDWLIRSMHSDGPVRVSNVAADDLPALVANYPEAVLPTYDGELVMTRHGVGCYTSQAAMKRWNRRNELLADAAERAAVAASLLGGYTYPKKTLREAWIRFLWHQFHDDLTGTSIPEAYEYSWNDELLSLNQFSSILTDAVSAVSPALDTRGDGIIYVLYNPLAVDRDEVAEIVLPLQDRDFDHVRVYGPNKKEVPSQLVTSAGDTVRVVFRANVPSVGFAVFDVRPAKEDYSSKNGVMATDSTLENERYRLALNANGDVASIRDKSTGRELLAEPIEWQLIANKPKQWPAWEIQYEDLLAGPSGKVGGNVTREIVEAGPVRGALRVTRQDGHSTYVTTIMMTTGAGSDRIDFVNEVDWAEKETLLKVAFKPTFTNDSVTYALGLGTITRGLSKEKKYEVPGHPWADIAAGDGSYGLGVMSDCKYGWDHPDPGTLRLTLIHTPGVYENWAWVGDQASQDIGHHLFTYSLVGHTGRWSDADVPAKASELLQPLTAFETPQHKGKLGRSCSLMSVKGNGQVAVSAVKQAEETDEIVIRVCELAGRNADDMEVEFDRHLLSVREVDGQENEIGTVEPDGRRFSFSLTAYQPKAFAVRLEKDNAVAPLVSRPLEIPYDLDGVSLQSDRTDGNVDGAGNSLAGELLPTELYFRDVRFEFGPSTPDANNVLSCSSQRLELPPSGDEGTWSDLYLLLMATGGPAEGEFAIEGDEFTETIPVSLYEYTEPVGQWNNRMVSGKMVSAASEILPAYINRTPVAWAGTHRHNADGADDIYKFTYLYAQHASLPEGAVTIVLPDNPNIKLLAASVAGREHDRLLAATPLYDAASTNLAAIQVTEPVFLDSTLVTFSSPTPGAVVRYTIDGSEPNISSPSYTTTLRLTETTTIRARAFDKNAGGGVAASLTVKKLIPREPVIVKETRPGLDCVYYEGEWQKVPNFDSLKAVREFVSDSVIIPEFARPEDYGLVFKGYIEVPSNGMYEFGISSDDGSFLFVADTLVVDNDGLHGEGELTGKVALQPGLHPLEIRMFQCKGGEALNLFVTGPGVEKQEVPETMLVH